METLGLVLLLLLGILGGAIVFPILLVLLAMGFFAILYGIKGAANITKDILREMKND